jgi:putative restriction endonuclease
MTPGPIASLDDAVERLYDLNVGVVGTAEQRHERPHKPVLLLAVLDLIASGEATPHRIPWSQVLRRRFANYFSAVQSRDDQNTPENPFRRLQTDEIWSPVEMIEGRAVRLNREPLVGECDSGKIWASFAGGLEHFVLTSDNRMRMRFALIERFFPQARAQLEPLFGEAALGQREPEPGPESDDDAPSRPGRNQAFRRKVIEVYDFQCAACGLRIKMPDVSDLTFVDAAHLVPFAESHNDHPTNGLALCKNHHWAMDRFLIAPCPDGIWRASPRLIARRSKGEEELVSLDGRRLISPADPAFKPSSAGLEWRCGRLIR